VERPDCRSEGGLTDVSLRHGSVERPKRVDLAEIVDQIEPRTRPLYIHFQFGPCMRFCTQMLAKTGATSSFAPFAAHSLILLLIGGLRDIGYDFAIRNPDKLPINPAIMAASISRVRYIGNAGLFLTLQ
jgi:hypothetical protein